MKKLVIFDLDGTLLNTIEDLAHSTNHALRLNGFKEHPTEEYKFFVGNGINKLFERALPEDARNEENILKIRKSFLEYYDVHNCDYTKPYKGITELLETLSNKGVAMAVASNKYDSATQNIVRHFFGSFQFASILGNVEGCPTKPNPQIVENTICKYPCDKSDILFVGDSGVDMQTAINAGVDACGVKWGFRPVEELEAFHPKYIVNSPEEIIKIII